MCATWITQIDFTGWTLGKHRDHNFEPIINDKCHWMDLQNRELIKQ